MRLILAAAVAAFATPALSLSCLPTDIAADYQRAAKADEEYIVVKGDLRFDTTKLPKTDWENQQNTPAQTDIPARFTGDAMTRTGFNHPFAENVTLRVLCFGPWCGGAGQGPYLAFVQRSGDTHVVTASPCPGMAYANPSPEMETQILNCARGRDCTSKLR